MQFKTTADFVLENVTAEIKQLDTINPDWRDAFSSEFMSAIGRALYQYSAISSLDPKTARQAQQKEDALLYVAMSVYTSIERVVRRKQIEEAA